MLIPINFASNGLIELVSVSIEITSAFINSLITFSKDFHLE